MNTQKKPSLLLHYSLWTILGLVVIGFIFGYLYSGLHQPFFARAKAPALPINSTVPPFVDLRDSADQPRSLNDFKGKIWVVDFIFTTCPSSCKTMTSRMKELQDALGKNSQVKLVSFTVDPETDTPSVLREYGKLHGANPSQWLFLTGPPASIYNIAHKGFYLGFQETSGEDAITFGKYTHSTRFALVDREGRVRAYHDAFDQQFIQKMLADIENLENEEKKP